MIKKSLDVRTRGFKEKKENKMMIFKSTGIKVNLEKEGYHIFLNLEAKMKG